MIGNPNRKIQAGLFVVCMAFCAFMAFEVQGEAFIQFEDIEGESENAQHYKWCDIISFEHKIQHSIESSTSRLTTLETATVGDIVVVKELDKASPKLAEACLKGVIIPFVRIEVVILASNTDNTYTYEMYYSYVLKNVMVSRYSISGSGQSYEKPIEQVSLHFEEIIAVYQTPDLQSDSYLGSGYQWKIEVGDS
ncbi:MAG: type VI secretion system tube protein Hcp [Deltaproteobacteria bacterium]|nr:type VI secretion system tube protein Hcp [Deltaproteobacteria bacterium]